MDIKSVLRDVTAHMFKKKFLDKQKTTLSSCRRKQKRKSGFRKR